MCWSHSDFGQSIYNATSCASRFLVLFLLLYISQKEQAPRSISIKITVTMPMAEAHFLVE